jgi:hypothetical protein
MLDDYKILESDFIGRDIEGLDDDPILSPDELKDRFDSIEKEVVMPKHNGVIDDLKSIAAGASGAGQVGIEPIEGLTTDPNVYAALVAIFGNVADNLTTDDAKKFLTAKQGVFLKKINFVGTLASAQSINNSTETTVLITALSNPDNLAVANGIVTIPAGWNYANVIGQVNFANKSTATIRFAKIISNGTMTPMQLSIGAGDMSINLSAKIPLNQLATTIKLNAFAATSDASASALTASGGHCFLCIELTKN